MIGDPNLGQEMGIVKSPLLSERAADGGEFLVGLQ